MNTVFVDNVNSIYLTANIKKVVFRGVGFPLITIHRYFRLIDAEITTLWIAKNIYGDTLYKSTIVSSSGQYVVRNLDQTVTQNLALEDALEYSMLDFIDTLSHAGVSKSEEHITSFKDLIPCPVGLLQPTVNPYR